jgi:hypothetical protein
VNTDIRINIEFWDHPKTVKMERRLGLQGIKSLQLLWFWAAKNAADGDLSHLDEEDIEIAARWTGESGIFFCALADLRWIDIEGEKKRLHEWHLHNPWAASAEERGDKARFSKMAQSFPAIYKTMKGQGFDSVTREDYDRIVSEITANRKRSASESLTERKADAGVSLAPSPSPSPKPNTNTKAHDEPIVKGESPVKAHPLKAAQKTPEFESTMNQLFEEFWELYPKKQNRRLARAAFDKLFFPALGKERLNERADNVVEQTRRYAQEVIGTEPRFIKMPENWLLAIDPDEVVRTETWVREEEIV